MTATRAPAGTSDRQPKSGWAKTGAVSAIVCLGLGIGFGWNEHPVSAVSPQASESLHPSPLPDTYVDAWDSPGAPTGAPSYNPTPPILKPSQFSGKAREAYQAAATCPNLLTQLLPVVSYGSQPKHPRLWHYFITKDGAHDSKVQDEVIEAARLCRQDVSLDQIRLWLVREFSAEVHITKEH